MAVDPGDSTPSEVRVHTQSARPEECTLMDSELLLLQVGEGNSLFLGMTLVPEPPSHTHNPKHTHTHTHTHLSLSSETLSRY